MKLLAEVLLWIVAVTVAIVIGIRVYGRLARRRIERAFARHPGPRASAQTKAGQAAQSNTSRAARKANAIANEAPEVTPHVPGEGRNRLKAAIDKFNQSRHTEKSGGQ